MQPDETPQDDLDALVRRTDPDRWLSSRFAGDARARADLIALYAFDQELARAPRTASNALLGEIRLTWWLEALAEIYEGRALRRHPTVLALAEAITRHGLPRGRLEAMIEARYRELDDVPMTAAEAVDWAAHTGGLAAEVAVSILDPAAKEGQATAAGAAWALGWRLADQPDLTAAFQRLLAEARTASAALSVAAFPAVAHAALAGRNDGLLGKRLRLTAAVVLGRI